MPKRDNSIAPVDAAIEPELITSEAVLVIDGWDEGLEGEQRSAAISIHSKGVSLLRSYNKGRQRFLYEAGQLCAQMRAVYKGSSDRGLTRWMTGFAAAVGMVLQNKPLSVPYLHNWSRIAECFDVEAIDQIDASALVELVKTRTTDEAREKAIQAAKEKFDQSGKRLALKEAQQIVAPDFESTKALYDQIGVGELKRGRQGDRYPYRFEAPGKTWGFGTIEQAIDTYPVCYRYVHGQTPVEDGLAARSMASEPRLREVDNEDLQPKKGKRFERERDFADQPCDRILLDWGWGRILEPEPDSYRDFGAKEGKYSILLNEDGDRVILHYAGFYWEKEHGDGDLDAMVAYGVETAKALRDELGQNLNHLRNDNPGKSKDFYTRSGKGEDGIDRDIANTPERLWLPGLKMLKVQEFELDPFTSEGAIVPAKVRWTVETDKEHPTLDRPWVKDDGTAFSGVWINHPWSKSKTLIPAVLSRIEEYEVGQVLWLTKFDCRTDWWNRLLEFAGAVLAVQGYDKFGADIEHSGALPMGICIFPIGCNLDDFATAYESIGTLLVPYRHV